MVEELFCFHAIFLLPPCLDMCFIEITLLIRLRGGSVKILLQRHTGISVCMFI